MGIGQAVENFLIAFFPPSQLQTWDSAKQSSQKKEIYLVKILNNPYLAAW